jgi:hypothetical protein
MIEQTPISQPCEQRRRLLLAYQEAALNYSQLVQGLIEAAGAVIHAEYGAISQRVKTAHKLYLTGLEVLMMRELLVVRMP